MEYKNTQTGELMTLSRYQALAQRTSNSKNMHDAVINGCLGLAGETGEVCDLLKKHLYQGHPLDTEKMLEELGDVLWYVAETAAGLGVDLWLIAQMNIAKLEARYPNGFDAERSRNREQ